MSRVFKLPFALAFAALLFPSSARAQQAGAAGAECRGPVYKSAVVARKARIFSKPEPGFTDEARKHDVSGVVRLTAVLCRDGRVTDIKVVEGLPHGITERAVEAARLMKFTPALKNRRRVSQSITLEYAFNVYPGDLSLKQWAKHAGRTVEEVMIEGNRRLIDKEILGYIRTRPGDRFDETQVRRDLQTLLGLRLFDARQTRVSTEAGARGGVVVIFNIVELPIIRQIKIEGLKSIGEADVLKTLRARRTGVHLDAPYEPARVESARRVIRQLLAARGFADAEVDVWLDYVTATTVSLKFAVREGRSGRWF